MLYILLHNLGKQGKLDYFFKKTGVIPTSCRAVIVKLQRRTPKDWQTTCDRNNLHIEFNLDAAKLGKKDPLPSKTYYYRELANAYSLIAKNSPDDTLGRTAIIRVTINTPEFRIESVSFGREVAKLAEVSDAKFIAIHLQKTVKVKEFPLNSKTPDFPPDLKINRHKKYF